MSTAPRPVAPASSSSIAARREPTLKEQLQHLDILEIIEVFLASEREYCRKLKIIADLEKRLTLHVKLGEPVIPQDEVNLIFGQIPQIYNFTNSLLDSLLKQRWISPNDCLDAFGELFMKEMPFFKLYANYNNDLNRSIELFEKNFNKNAKFRSFVQFNEMFYDLNVNTAAAAANTKPMSSPQTKATSLQMASANGGLALSQNGSAISALIRLPSGHFSKYVLFLSEMCRALKDVVGNDDPEDFPAYISLQTTFKAMLGVLDLIARKAEENLRVSRVIDVQTILFKDNVSLIDPSRRYYRSSNVRIRDLKNFDSIQEVMLVLFNDCILYATAPSFGFGGYKCIDVMPIAGLNVDLEVKGGYFGNNAFRLSNVLTAQTWEVGVIANKSPFEQKETPEKSYYMWLSNLVEVYDIFYNLNTKTQQTQKTVLSPADLKATILKQPCLQPKRIDKPESAPLAHVKAAVDRIDATRKEKRVQRQAPSAPQPAARPAPTALNTNTTTTTTSTHTTAAPVPPTPRRAPLPTAKAPTAPTIATTTTTTTTATPTTTPTTIPRRPSLLSRQAPTAPARPAPTPTHGGGNGSGMFTAQNASSNNNATITPTGTGNTPTGTPSNAQSTLSAASNTPVNDNPFLAQPTTTTTTTTTTAPTVSRPVAPTRPTPITPTHATTTVTTSPAAATKSPQLQQQASIPEAAAPAAVVAKPEPTPEPTPATVAPTPAPTAVVTQPKPEPAPTPTVVVTQPEPAAPEPTPAPTVVVTQPRVNPLLGAIQSADRTALRTVTEDEKPAARAAPTNDIFGQLRGGVALRKVQADTSKPKPAAQPLGLEGDLISSLEKYRKFVANDDDSDDEDEDW